MRERGIVIASARVLRRAWQIYVAHIFLFTIFMAEIAYVAATFDNPLYAEEMNILDFLKQPDITIFQALLLKFKPVNMDVLPLYIALLLFSRRCSGSCCGSRPWPWRARPWSMYWPGTSTGICRPIRTASVLQSVRLAIAVRVRRVVRARRRATAVARAALARRAHVAIAYLLFAFAITLTWYIEPLQRFVPGWLSDWMYPIDKTNLDVLRFAHFLALAAVTVRFVPRDWPLLKSPLLRPAILCGQHSLEIFCLGVFLAFAGQFIIGEWSGGP